MAASMTLKSTEFAYLCHMVVRFSSNVLRLASFDLVENFYHKLNVSPDRTLGVSYPSNWHSRQTSARVKTCLEPAKYGR